MYNLSARCSQCTAISKVPHASHNARSINVWCRLKHRFAILLIFSIFNKNLITLLSFNIFKTERRKRCIIWNLNNNYLSGASSLVLLSFNSRSTLTPYQVHLWIFTLHIFWNQSLLFLLCSSFPKTFQTYFSLASFLSLFSNLVSD